MLRSVVGGTAASGPVANPGLLGQGAWDEVNYLPQDSQNQKQGGNDGFPTISFKVLWGWEGHQIEESGVLDPPTVLPLC